MAACLLHICCEEPHKLCRLLAVLILLLPLLAGARQEAHQGRGALSGGRSVQGDSLGHSSQQNHLYRAASAKSYAFVSCLNTVEAAVCCCIRMD